MKIKNIFFDFDGVIAESVSAKTDAFEAMYLPYGKYVAEKVVTYHKLHGGISRYEKFRYFHKEFLNEVIDDDRVNELATQFSNIVLEKVINSNEVKGAKYFIEKYSKNFKFWIITGTPNEEIKLIVDKRKLKNYFLGVHGSPNNKRYWTEYLIKKYKLNREEIIFLGDATTDMDAAKYSKIHFALRENDENKELFKNYKGHRFNDFYQFEKLIKNYK